MAHKMLDGVAVTGVSNSIFLAKKTSSHTYTCYYTDANGSISALTIDLEASDDPRGVSDADAHWYQLSSNVFSGAELTAKQSMAHATSRPVKRVRLNITVLTGEGVGDLIYARYEEGEI